MNNFEAILAFIEKLNTMTTSEKNTFLEFLFPNDVSILFSRNGIDSEILEENNPDWIRAYVNASDKEKGRKIALEDLIATFLTESAIL